MERPKEQTTDLDWIFANYSIIIKEGIETSIQALANCFGMGDLRGNGGDPDTYIGNVFKVLDRAQPYLKIGDKAGWLAFCAKIKKIDAQKGAKF